MKTRDYLNKNYNDTLIALTYLLDKPKSYILLNPDLDLDEEIEKSLDKILALREKNYPLQYAIGYWEFYGINFKVDERALIPRFETEIIVDYIIKGDFKKDRILDIGTGSGAISLSLGENLKDSAIIGSDIEDKALDLASLNRSRLGISNVDFIKSDLFQNIDSKFDIIVSNPPYIKKEDYERLEKELYYEPKSALLAEDEGLYFYKKIIKGAKDYLNDGGLLIFEIGYDQKLKLIDLLNKSDFKNIISMKDYNDFDRFIVAKKG